MIEWRGKDRLGNCEREVALTRVYFTRSRVQLLIVDSFPHVDYYCHHKRKMSHCKLSLCYEEREEAVTMVVKSILGMVLQMPFTRKLSLARTISRTLDLDRSRMFCKYSFLIYPLSHIQSLPLQSAKKVQLVNSIVIFTCFLIPRLTLSGHRACVE